MTIKTQTFGDVTMTHERASGGGCYPNFGANCAHMHSCVYWPDMAFMCCKLARTHAARIASVTESIMEVMSEMDMPVLPCDAQSLAQSLVFDYYRCLRARDWETEPESPAYS